MNSKQSVEPATPLPFRLALMCLCLGGVIVAVATDYVGAGMEAANGEAAVRAGSSPAAVGWSVLAISALILFFSRARRPKALDSVRWGRRFLAVTLDIATYLTSVAGLIALTPLFVEANRTGTFHWSFSRNTVIWQDWFSIGIPTCAALVLFILYIAWPIFSGKQTVGGYIMRVAVVSDGSDKPPLRTCLLIAVWYLLDIWVSPVPGRSLLERAGYKLVTVR